MVYKFAIGLIVVVITGLTFLAWGATIYMVTKVADPEFREETARELGKNIRAFEEGLDAE